MSRLAQRADGRRRLLGGEGLAVIAPTQRAQWIEWTGRKISQSLHGVVTVIKQSRCLNILSK